MNTLGVRVAQWSLESYHGKAVLMGSKPWIKKVINDSYGYLLHHLRGVTIEKPYTVRLIDYQNFITGVEVVGDESDFDLLMGWCCRRGLFVIEKAVYPFHNSRYLDLLEGLDVGESTTFWCD